MLINILLFLRFGVGGYCAGGGGSVGATNSKRETVVKSHMFSSHIFT